MAHINDQIDELIALRQSLLDKSNKRMLQDSVHRILSFDEFVIEK